MRSSIPTPISSPSWTSARAPRRDHQKYLTLIDAIALLHQHQREVKTITIAPDGTGANGGTGTIEYIEVAPSDIALANRLAHEVLGRSIDELPPQTRVVLGGVCALVAEKMKAQGLPRSDIRFTRRELRERTNTSDTQLKVHLARLVELEYLFVHRAARGQGHIYELVYDGDSTNAPHLCGLIDLGILRYDDQRSAQNGEQPGSGRCPVGARPECADCSKHQHGSGL